MSNTTNTTAASGATDSDDALMAREMYESQDDSLLLCASDLQHSAIYDNHIEMQSCIRAVADRITALASVIAGVERAALATPAQAAALVTPSDDGFMAAVNEMDGLYAAPAQAVPASVIMASVMRDDGGEHPAFCLMVAYRAEKDAMAALAMLTDEPAQAAAPAPASHPVAAPTQAGEYPAGTGNPEADRIIGRLASSDPDFDDCADAVALIHKLVAEIKGPDGFATWKDAAVAERVRRVEATRIQAATEHPPLPRHDWCLNCSPVMPGYTADQMHAYADATCAARVVYSRSMDLVRTFWQQHTESDALSMTMAELHDDVELVIRAARKEVAQAAPVGMEPVYQIGQPFQGTWRDASKDVYDVCMPSERRIIYTASQTAAVQQDAERYRWLREYAIGAYTSVFRGNSSAAVYLLTRVPALDGIGEETDAAIDAARTAQKEAND